MMSPKGAEVSISQAAWLQEGNDSKNVVEKENNDIDASESGSEDDYESVFGESKD